MARSAHTSWPILLLCALLLPARTGTAQEYDDFENHGQRRVEQFIGRAERLSDEQAWNNYVELGIATERIAWESEAYDQLQLRIEDIEETQTDEETRDAEIAAAEADFEDARQQWETGATEFLNEERGRFLAREEALDVARDAARRFEALITAAEAEATRAALLESNGTEQALADVPGARDELRNFDRRLDTELSRARATAAGLTGVERTNFDDELIEIENEIRREFEIRKNYFFSDPGDDATGPLIALPRQGDLESGLAPADRSARESREELTTRARAAIEDDTNERLDRLRARFEIQLGANASTALDPDELAADWARRTAAIQAEADAAWQSALADFTDRRSAWLRERGTPDGLERRAWTENAQALEREHEAWQEEINERFAEARADWEERLESERSEADEERR